MSIYAARFIFLGIFRSLGGVWICVVPRLCLTWDFHHYPAVVGGLFRSVSFFATGQLAGLTSLFTCSPSSLYGLPWSSAGKESACNAGDPSSIPESGRSHGEGIGYPLQYSLASLVAHLVKNLLAMCEIWVQKIPWRRVQLPTPVFWPGEFHGLSSLWDHRVGHD